MAGIDCVGLVTGAIGCDCFPTLVKKHSRIHTSVLQEKQSQQADSKVIIDPCPSEHREICARLCVLHNLQSRDEVTELWAKGDVINSAINHYPDQTDLDVLLDQAVEAAIAARLVFIEAIGKSTELKLQRCR